MEKTVMMDMNSSEEVSTGFDFFFSVSSVSLR